MAVIKNEERRDALELAKENEDLLSQELMFSRKSEFVSDEFFDASPLPISAPKDPNKYSFSFAREFNRYMHIIGKDPAFVMCRKCKEWVETNYQCCGV